MKTKICTRCNSEKEINNFPFKNKSKDIRHSACNTCWVTIRQESYIKNKRVTFIRNQRNSKKNRDWFQEYKKTLSCVKCGENHPACLDFHHKDPSEKSFSVSLVAGHTTSKKQILKEIAKCKVLCSNCHRKLHFDELNN